MKKEIIISIIVIAVVIIADITTSKITDSKITDMNNKLAMMKETINGRGEDLESNEEILNQARNIKNTWEEYNNILSYYVEHEELEKVGTEINCLYNYAKCNDQKESLDSITRLEFILEHISQKHDFTLNNFF